MLVAKHGDGLTIFDLLFVTAKAIAFTLSVVWVSELLTTPDPHDRHCAQDNLVQSKRALHKTVKELEELHSGLLILKALL